VLDPFDHSVALGRLAMVAVPRSSPCWGRSPGAQFIVAGPQQSTPDSWRTTAMPQKKPKPNVGAVRWVRVYQVWHVRAKRYIRRKDGEPFVFRVRGPR